MAEKKNLVRITPRVILGGIRMSPEWLIHRGYPRRQPEPNAQHSVTQRPPLSSINRSTESSKIATTRLHSAVVILSMMGRKWAAQRVGRRGKRLRAPNR